MNTRDGCAIENEKDKKKKERKRLGLIEKRLVEK